MAKRRSATIGGPPAKRRKHVELSATSVRKTIKLDKPPPKRGNKKAGPPIIHRLADYNLTRMPRMKSYPIPQTVESSDPDIPDSSPAIDSTRFYEPSGDIPAFNVDAPAPPSRKRKVRAVLLPQHFH